MQNFFEQTFDRANLKGDTHTFTHPHIHTPTEHTITEQLNNSNQEQNPQQEHEQLKQTTQTGGAGRRRR
jgi:hypothetical protein